MSEPPVKKRRTEPTLSQDEGLKLESVCSTSAGMTAVNRCYSGASNAPFPRDAIPIIFESYNEDDMLETISRKYHEECRDRYHDRYVHWDNVLNLCTAEEGLHMLEVRKKQLDKTLETTSQTVDKAKMRSKKEEKALRMLKVEDRVLQDLRMEIECGRFLH